MSDLKLKDVVCVFMKEYKDAQEHEELIHIELSETEALDYIEYQIKAQLEKENLTEISVEQIADGVCIKHWCDKRGVYDNRRLYDRFVEFTYRKDYGKLLVSE